MVGQVSGSLHPHPSAVVVYGPPLPGRRALVRAIERRLPHAHRVRGGRRGPAIPEILASLRAGEVPIIEADLRTGLERRALHGLFDDAGAHVVFVAWMLDANDAQREIYRRYASLPRRYADHWWHRWQDDALKRDPTGTEVPPGDLVWAGARQTRADAVARIARTLGLPVEEPRQPDRRRVLVVDDEADQREILGSALEELGCEVYTARNAYEALGEADRHPLDLVVTDAQMPGPSGLDLARELARRHPEVHVALLTGFAEDLAERAAHSEGVELIFKKPVAAGDLVKMLDELTE
jgi:CheY-like chemotaxis protein